MWSDVIQDVTTLFAPPARIWKQIQMFTPMRSGERRWEARIVLAGGNVDEVVRILADRNNCPPTLIRRTLNGNLPIESYADYLAFTESLVADLPRLSLQRMIAMRGNEPPPENQASGGHVLRNLHGHWPIELPDPRNNPAFYQLHL